MSKTLEDLYRVICARKKRAPANSYTAQLFRRGRSKIAQKVGEEATELVIAAVRDKKKEIVAESADVLYHWLVLLAHADVPLSDVMAALASRKGASGLDEKAARKKKPVKKKAAKKKPVKRK